MAYGYKEEFGPFGFWSLLSDPNFDFTPVLDPEATLAIIDTGKKIAGSFYTALDAIRKKIPDVEETPASRFLVKRGAVFRQAGAAIWRITSESRGVAATFFIEFALPPRDNSAQVTLLNPQTKIEKGGVADIGIQGFIRVVKRETLQFQPLGFLETMPLSEFSAMMFLLYLRQVAVSGGGDPRKGTIRYNKEDIIPFN